jgi:hypothetical protein
VCDDRETLDLLGFAQRRVSLLQLSFGLFLFTEWHALIGILKVILYLVTLPKLCRLLLDQQVLTLAVKRLYLLGHSVIGVLGLYPQHSVQGIKPQKLLFGSP